MSQSRLFLRDSEQQAHSNDRDEHSNSHRDLSGQVFTDISSRIEKEDSECKITDKKEDEPMDEKKLSPWRNQFCQCQTQ